MAPRRYIVKSALVTYSTLGGALDQEVWLGWEIDGPVNLAFLSRHGYHFVPAEGLTEDELQSVGVTEFETIVVAAEDFDSR